MRGLFLSVLFAVSATYIPVEAKKYKYINCSSIPERTVVVFDFHGVIAKPRAGKAIKGFFKNKKKSRFIGKLLKKEKGVAYEKAFLNKDGQLSKDDRRTLNPHTIDEEVVQIARDIKAKGYPVFLCTDMGEDSFNYFKDKRPDLFGEDGLFCACWCSGRDNCYVCKKEPKAFELCKNMIKNWAKKNQVLEPTSFVMIDDSSSKLDAARINGFSCYKFKNNIKRSAAKRLRRALEIANIL